ncbi:MAG: alcohol dehydrogenase catalytic domain-containing protein [bacterium]
MKAIAKVRNDRGLEIIESSYPNILPDDYVLVRVDGVSICGTDLHIYEWDEWAKNRIKIPRIIGHEGTGIVEEIGKNVKNVRAGQRISFESHLPCLNCYQCKTGKMHICLNLNVLGIDIDGLFRKYVSVPSFIVIPNDFGIEAAILEPMGNAFHCLHRVNVSGKFVGILGDGPIALFLFYFAQKFGASKIFLIGASSYRIELAYKLNKFNHYVLHYREPVEDIIKKETDGRMLDVVFEMAGVNQTVNMGLDLLGMGGKFVAFGILPNTINLDYNKIIFKAIDIVSINGRVMFDTWYFMMNIVKKEEIGMFVTHYFDFDEYQEAFRLLINRQALKVILKV